MLRKELTKQIIGAFYDVYNGLGPGFLERVYENALAFELRERGLKVQQQFPIVVRYKGVVVGDYFADLLVEECILIELKAVDALCDAHTAQLLNYLKATDSPIGLLFNFGPEPELRRRILTLKPNS